MNLKAMRSNMLLILTALIWGFTFVAQSVGLDYIGPFTITAGKCLIGGIVLLPVIRFTGRANSDDDKQTSHDRKILISGGIACGCCLAAASLFQQFGLAYTTAGRAGFLTAMYILIVPFLGLFLKRRLPSRIGICLILAVLGLYLLCMTGDVSFNKGDALELTGALGFAVHILTIDHFSDKADGVRMSCIQFFTAALICAVPAVITESPSLSDLWAARIPLLYAGVLSCGVGFTLQIVAQKDTDPVIASLLLSLESSFSVLAGWIVLHQYLSPKELLGCLMMFAGIILAQIPDDRLNIFLKSFKK